MEWKAAVSSSHSPSLNFAHTLASLSFAMSLCSCLLLNGLDSNMHFLDLRNVQNASVACRVSMFGDTVYWLPGEDKTKKVGETRRENKIIYLGKIGKIWQIYYMRTGCC